MPTDYRDAEVCIDPTHTTTTVTDGDTVNVRCGECGRAVYADDVPLGPAAAPQADIYDATTPDGIEQLPAVNTNMTPAQFKAWVTSDGALFMVMLPANRTFVIKVPAAHHEFFVAMMQQVRFALGPEVQAVRMNMVAGPDDPTGTGVSAEAPAWAQPQPPTEHVDPEQCPNDDLRCSCPPGRGHRAGLDR